MILHIKIKPNNKFSQLEKDDAGNWMMRVKSPPVDGKANAEVIRRLSEIIKVPKSAIQLVSGQTHSIKRFKIDELSDEEVQKRMEKYLRSET